MKKLSAVEKELKRLKELEIAGDILTVERRLKELKEETGNSISALRKFMKTIELPKVEEVKEKPIPVISYPKVSREVYLELLHNWFYFKDDEIIDIQLAGLIGEKIPGDPLWIFIIAPPGALKTETLRGFVLNDDFYPLSDLSSKTFVSGLMVGKGEARRKIEDLLPQLNKKVLIFKDLTTVLEKNRDERQEIFAQLREIYDGAFAKKFGTMDEAVRYTSRFGLIAGVTPVVDKHWKLMQQLGERFVKVRWNENIDEVTTRARENEGKEKQMREEISKTAMGFISNLDFSNIPVFNDERYGETLDRFAKFVAIGRTPVIIQDYRTDFYFDFIPMPERPTRLVKQFKKLAKCLALIRGKDEVDEAEIMTIMRVSKDTIPQDRLAILETIKANDTNIYGCPKFVICDKVKIPESSVTRVLQQLKMLELITEKTVEDTTGTYTKRNCYYKITEKTKYGLTPPTFTVEVKGKREGTKEKNDPKNIQRN